MPGARPRSLSERLPPFSRDPAVALPISGLRQNADIKKLWAIPIIVSTPSALHHPCEGNSSPTRPPNKFDGTLSGRRADSSRAAMSCHVHSPHFTMSPHATPFLSSFAQQSAAPKTDHLKAKPEARSDENKAGAEVLNRISLSRRFPQGPQNPSCPLYSNDMEAPERRT